VDIPEEIRKRLGLEAGAQFVVVGEGDVVVLKAINAPQMGDFKALLDRAQESAAAAGLEPGDVERAIREVRSEGEGGPGYQRPGFGIFFGECLVTDLDAWAAGRFELIPSPSMFDALLGDSPQRSS
jgi:bifunctional DNA-binding transcriptional regulator/antitoxin component of YhaV-PrlF toxin-antitoxin module